MFSMIIGEIYEVVLYHVLYATGFEKTQNILYFEKYHFEIFKPLWLVDAQL